MYPESKLINSVNFKHFSNDLEVTALDERLNTSDIICLTEIQLHSSAEPCFATWRIANGL